MSLVGPQGHLRLSLARDSCHISSGILVGVLHPLLHQYSGLISFSFANQMNLN
jgi:hypothetical protein